MAKTLYEVLDQKFVDIQSEYERSVTGGGAQDYAAYKETCGVIRGLALARREVQDLAKNYMENDDD